MALAVVLLFNGRCTCASLKFIPSHTQPTIAFGWLTQRNPTTTAAAFCLMKVPTSIEAVGVLKRKRQGCGFKPQRRAPPFGVHSRSSQ